MKKTITVSLFLFLAACSGGRGPGSSSVPGHGAISVQINPNPIVATRVGNDYEFPFDVIVHETGGRPVNVTRVSATVRGPAGISLGTESWDADRIRALGYPTSVNANGEVRLHFSPRRSVPDDRLFNGVEALLTVDATDDTSTPASASTTVTVTR